MDVEAPGLSYTGEIIEKNLPPGFLDGASVLDAGCGYNARVIRLVNQRFKPEKIKGIDVNREVVEHCATFGISNASFERVSLDELELNETFDFIICEGVLMYCREPGKIIDCFEKHLKPGGRMLIGVYCWKNPYKFFSFVFRKIVKIIGYEKAVAFIPSGNYSLMNFVDSIAVPVEHYFDINNILEVLEEKFEVTSFGFVPSFIPIIEKPSKLLTRLCGNYYYHIFLKKSGTD
jgi:SAM-dependent methyltransferase